MPIRDVTLPVLVLAALAGPSLAFAAPDAPLTGRWLVTETVHGVLGYQMMDLTAQGDDLSGSFGGQKVKGAVKAGAVHLEATDPDGGETFDGTLANGVITGAVLDYDNADKDHPDRYTFTATRAPERPNGPPQRHAFTPQVFYREFSPLNPPALTVSPGDSIQTSTVDAGGTDAQGVKRVLGGNPQTGPFYVTSAMPGDTLVVHLTRLRLNRDFAVSDDSIVSRAVDNGLAVKMKDTGKTVIWTLDRDKGLASPQAPGPHLAHYTVPVLPMLGCVAVAPPPGRAAPNTGDSGSYGGNMDFNELVEGATLYLPVSVPGAMLYLGDGHAAQGDGELTGNALETSLDVEFTVEVIPGRRTPSPRLESDTQIMAMGLSGSVDDALKSATSNMALWLTQDYKLTPSEIAEVLGSAAAYKISEVADRNAGVVVKLPKKLLAAIK